MARLGMAGHGEARHGEAWHGMARLGLGMIYVVAKGDTLSEIAERLCGDASRWRELRLAKPAPGVMGMRGEFLYSSRIYPDDLLRVPMDWKVPFMLSPAWEALQKKVTHNDKDYRPAR